MKYLILLSTLSLFSCSKNIEYFINEGNEVALRPNTVELMDSKVMVWKVGARRKQRVSKGVFVRFDLPTFLIEDLKDLVFRRGVDSWLVRLRKKTLATSKIVDRSFVPFVQQGSLNSSDKLYVNQQQSLTYSIYYRAASKARWVNRPCPLYNHVYEINEMEVERAPKSERVLIINAPIKKNYIDLVNPYGSVSRVINAGNSLVGKYSLEIALYNSVKKERKTDFFVASDALAIKKEIRKTIEGCKDYKYNEKLDDSDVIDSFKFGQ